VSSYPSMGAGVSFRIGPFARGPVPKENFFAFRENPFSLTPNPRFLHRTRQAHETLGRLTRGILERRGLILLCGPVGTGKTTLLYSALHLMDVSPAVQNKIGTAVIVHPTLTRDEFLEAVLDEFDVECASTRRDRRLEALLNMLLDVRRRGGVAVLVIDEAQLLSADVLEEVRTLLSLQTSQERLLQVVLCGQPELEGKLAGMNLRRGEPFVAVRCGTAALSLKDTHDYVQHRLRIAGARSDALFTPEAVDAVHAHTGGIPRLINLLCGQALSVASYCQAGRVFPIMVAEAAAKICSGALTSPSDSSATASRDALENASLNLSSGPSSQALLAPSVTTLQGLPLLCDSDAGSSVLDSSVTATVDDRPHVENTDCEPADDALPASDPARAEEPLHIADGDCEQVDTALRDAEPANIEAAAHIADAEVHQADAIPSDAEPTKVDEPAEAEHGELEQVGPMLGSAVPEISESAGPVQASRTNAIAADASSSDAIGMGASSAEPQVLGSKEPAALDGVSAVQAARSKRRALYHRAKFAQSVRVAQAGGRRTVKCDFTRSSATPLNTIRRPSFRPSPFRRGKFRPSHLRMADVRGLQQYLVANVAGSLPAWNLWLNRWCSEHFTSKSCGKPLFQLGLAGTLFLALAQAIAAGFPRQHVAHVAFGFLGMLFIDISLGLGTYLLLIERRFTPASRGGWAQLLRRRLG
jgi:general secretion pathway protein A